MNTFTLRGAAAEIRWGYRAVATLGSWTWKHGVVTATVLQKDDFGISQSPLSFIAGSITEPIHRLQISGWTLTASIGPQETTHESVSLRSA
jgi:hypothetical protein